MAPETDDFSFQIAVSALNKRLKLVRFRYVCLVLAVGLCGQYMTSFKSLDQRRRLIETPSKGTSSIRKAKRNISPSIAVVTTSYYDDKPQAYNRFTDHFMSKACYASRHGYDHYLDTYNRLPDNLHPKFAKTFLSMQLMEKYDWLFFSDDDVLINSFDYKLENILEGFGNVDVHLMVPKDHKGPDNLHFSNYAFLIRSSDFGRKILQDWFHSFQTCQLATPFIHWPDQSNMWLMIAKNVYEYYNLTVPPAIQQICWENTTRVNGQDLLDIAMGSLKKLNFTTAQSVMSERQLQAPVAWSELDQYEPGRYQLGLGVQLNHRIHHHNKERRKQQELKEMNALSIHIKEKYNASRITVLPRFRNNMTQCFGRFHVPNMTIVEQHSLSKEPVSIDDIRNLKLYASLDEYRYGHRRSLTTLPPSKVCIQQTSNLYKEDAFATQAWERFAKAMIRVPRGVRLQVQSESCTNYEDLKWDYKRHTIQGTSHFESSTWKILFLRDPIQAFFSRFAQHHYADRCSSGDMDTADEVTIYNRSLSFIKRKEEELNPFAFSLDKVSRTEKWIPRARLHEFVVILDPTQWNITQENARNALGIELNMNRVPLCISECGQLVANRLKSWDAKAYDAVMTALFEHNKLDFELYEYARELVREQNEFYREVPARGVYLYRPPVLIESK